MSAESWHIVEAKRADGEAAIFRIREMEPRRELATIFVVEMPYETTEMSKLPGATAYRRLAGFEEAWLGKACDALGWVFVGVRIEDGSFFLYLYGDAEPGDLVARLAPFDGALGFYDDRDPAWGEYRTMRELLDQAKKLPKQDGSGLRKQKAKAKAKAKAPAAKAKPKAKARANAKATTRPLPKAKPKRRAAGSR